MDNLADMIWIEQRKAIRSRMPLWTGLGSLFMPLGIVLLLLIARNPEISQKLGLIGAKATLLNYSAIDWPAYLDLYGQLIAMGGFFLNIMIISWVFGREWADGTLKDMLAVPVRRASILLAKFIVMAGWCGLLVLVIFVFGLLAGALIGLPGATPGLLLAGSLRLLLTGVMAIVVTLPFALLASAGRGFLLPIGISILTLMASNILMVLGWADYFPWAVPGLFAQASSSLPAVSFWLVLASGLLGILATYLWWKYADQHR